MNIRSANTADIPAIQLLYRQLDQHHAAVAPEVFQVVDTNARPDTLLKQWIDDPNAAARGFYRHHGFEPITERLEMDLQNPGS